MSYATVNGPDAPARPDVRTRIAGTWAGVAAALVFGLLADAVVRAVPGLALTIGTWFAVVAVVPDPAPCRGVAVPRRRDRAGAFFTLRASPVLLGLDLLGATALLSVAATFAGAGAPAATTVRSPSALVRSIVEPFAAIPDGISSLAGPPARELNGKASARAVARAIVIIPVAALLAVLLGSADPVFRRFVHVPSVEPNVWPPHVAAVAIGAVSLATLVALGEHGRVGQLARRRRRLVRGVRGDPVRPVLGRPHPRVDAGRAHLRAVRARRVLAAARRDCDRGIGARVRVARTPTSRARERQLCGDDRPVAGVVAPGGRGRDRHRERR